MSHGVQKISRVGRKFSRGVENLDAEKKTVAAWSKN